MVDAHPARLGLACSAGDIWRHFRAGRLASLIGVEGLHQIAGRASNIRLFHRLGVRYITLCHDRSNEYVDSAVRPGQPFGNLILVLTNSIRLHRPRAMAEYRLPERMFCLR